LRGRRPTQRIAAFRLLEEKGYDFHLRAKEVAVREGVTIDDADYAHVRPNMGPMIVRGVCYPCWNVGFGAPGSHWSPA
jgi:hypothetical protein